MPRSRQAADLFSGSSRAACSAAVFALSSSPWSRSSNACRTRVCAFVFAAAVPGCGKSGGRLSLANGGGGGGGGGAATGADTGAGGGRSGGLGCWARREAIGQAARHTTTRLLARDG